MKISFVIPAFNEEAHLRPCIESILQAISHLPYEFEIIVVNNASTDGTRRVAESFTSVKVVDEPVKGLSSARHRGFLVSTGSLVANIDADTLVNSQWVATVISEFSKQPHLIALSGPFVYYDLPIIHKFFVRVFYFAGYASYVLNRFILNTSSMLQGGNYVVKRSALETIGGFDSKFSFYGEDTDTARKLHALGAVKFTFDLPMTASGRRIAAEGLLTMGLRYSINHFWTIFLKRPFSLDSVAVRPQFHQNEKQIK